MCKWPRVLGGVLGVLASPAPRPHAPRTRHTHTTRTLLGLGLDGGDVHLIGSG
jgi:hypothetical protein